MKLPEGVGTIGVFRALMLGDLLVMIPAMRALRRSYPKAKISLIGLKWAVDFVERFDQYFDELIWFPGFPGLAEQPVKTREALRFLEVMRRRRFDLLLQMHGDGSIVNPLLYLIKPNYFAGYYQKGFFWKPSEYFMEYEYGVSEVERHVRLMEFLGIKRQGLMGEFPLKRGDEREWRRLGLELAPERYVVIHPGAADPERRWEPEKFARLGKEGKQRGYEVVITGVKSEKRIGEEVVQLIGGRVWNLVGKTSLGGLGMVVSRSKLVISNDTGAAHVAVSLNKPLVVVSLAKDQWRWRPVDKGKYDYLDGRQEGVFEKVLEAVRKRLL